jgi:sugar phosphate isomerase/epimerase
MPSDIKDLSNLCVHTITTKALKFETACMKYAQYGIKGISIWRDAVEGIHPRKVKEILKNNDLTAVSYVRGGFFPSLDKAKRKAALEDNLEMMKEAAAMEIPLLVLVCGSDPDQSLQTSRDQIKYSISKLLPEASKLGVSLAIEPLHPMYADTRSAITSLKQANDMAEYFNDSKFGVAIDVYHLWFDEELEQQIYRCGENNNLYAFHICDWKVPTTDMLNDRGLMGEGCIPVRKIREWVEKAGFQGFNEVEIFSNSYWSMDQDLFLEKIVDAYLTHS